MTPRIADEQPRAKVMLMSADPSVVGEWLSLRQRFDVETVAAGFSSVERLRPENFGLIAIDGEFSSPSATALLEAAAAAAPDTVRIILIDSPASTTLPDAINRAHVYAALNRRARAAEVERVVENGVRHYEFVRQERKILQETLSGSLKLLVDMVGVFAPAALGKGIRLRDAMRRMARWLGREAEWELVIAALLSPLSYAAIPDSLLQKVAAKIPLDEKEQAIWERSPQTAHDLIADIPRLSEVARIIRYQGKRFDGEGFPADDTAGERLPFGSRVLKILIDRIELEEAGTILSHALREMEARAGYYDLHLLRACFECLPEILASTTGGDTPAAALSVERLAVGQILTADVLTRNGTKLIAAGNRLDALTLQRLRNFAELQEILEPIFVQMPATPIHVMAEEIAGLPAMDLPDQAGHHYR